MSASMSLFPSPAITLPRKSSLKNPLRTNPTPPPGELQGVAFQVTAGTPSPSRVQPAAHRVRHPRDAEPASDSTALDQSPKSALGRRDGRRRSRPASIVSHAALHGCEDAAHLEDQLSPLPENTRFGRGSPPRRTASPQLSRPTVLTNISTATGDDQVIEIDVDDTLSPLPETTRFRIVTPTASEFPVPRSVGSRSASPAPGIPTSKFLGGNEYGSPATPSASSAGGLLGRSNSTATNLPPYSPPASRSLFPTYDSSRPLADQPYYPTSRPAIPVFSSEKNGKMGNLTARHDNQPVHAEFGLVDGYEHIPAASSTDLEAICNASSGRLIAGCRKTKLQLHQAKGGNMSLSIGVSAEELLYTVDKVQANSTSKESTTWTSLAVQRHLTGATVGVQIAQLAIPNALVSKPNKDRLALTIFPQPAAMQALEAASSSSQATELAAIDPAAESPAAVRLAQDAITEAHRNHACELLRTTRKRDSLGAVTATYELEHPSLGTFPVTIKKSSAGRHTHDARAKISLHHPSATAAAIAADTLVLAFLDFARDACVLDLPGLLALDNPHIIDTAVSALVAVAFIENAAIMTELVSFEPPPKTAVGPEKLRSALGPAKLRKQRRKSSMFRKAQEELAGEQVDLPVLSLGALALLSFSLKGAILVLQTGVKVTASAIIGVSHLTRKT